MKRRVLLVTPFLLLGCASPRTTSSVAADAPSSSSMEARFTEALAERDAASGTFTQGAPPPQRAPAPPARPRPRVNVKGGYWDASEDELDDGFIFNVSLIRPVSEIFSSEVEIGYLDASGSEGLFDSDLWAIPFMVNGRVAVPLGRRFEIYGGLGLGSFYYDADFDSPGVSISADGFLFGGNAFFGGAIQLGEALWVGVEDKYYVTDSASDLDGDLDANVIMLTLGFSR